MATKTFSEADTRKEVWERDIKGFAPKRYVMKELVMNLPSNAWTNSFYQKTASSLTAGTGSDVDGIPRGGEFPFLERGVELKSAVITQHGAEGTIYWQDILTSNLAVETETISDITDGVVFSTDTKIYRVLSENDTPDKISEVAIDAGFEWDSDTVQNRDPFFDIMRGVEAIQTARYPILTSGMGFVAMNESTYTFLITNSKILNHPTWKQAEGIIKNGRLASIGGLQIYVSPVITNDKVLVGMRKKCGTWRQTQPLTVDVIKDPQKKYTIRASEIGVCQLTDPEALCLLTNVRK